LSVHLHRQQPVAEDKWTKEEADMFGLSQLPERAQAPLHFVNFHKNRKHPSDY